MKNQLLSKNSRLRDTKGVYTPPSIPSCVPASSPFIVNLKFFEKIKIFSGDFRELKFILRGIFSRKNFNRNTILLDWNKFTWKIFFAHNNTPLGISPQANFNLLWGGATRERSDTRGGAGAVQ